MYYFIYQLHHTVNLKTLSIKIDEKDLLCDVFYTKTKVKLLSADEKVATLKSSPGITIGPKNYEVEIEFSFLSFVYSTGTIITCSLYIFYPIFEGKKRFFKELYS